MKIEIDISRYIDKSDGVGIYAANLLFITDQSMVKNSFFSELFV